MGSRGRSIRLRIYFLVAIPLVAMVGLLAYVAGTSINNAISLDRAPNLVNATGIPAADFGVHIEAERAAAVVYLFRPTAANLASYQAATAATDKAKPAFVKAMTSQATSTTEDASGAKQVSVMLSGLNQLPALRNAVKARVLTPLDALNFYSQGITANIKLFLVQTESVVVTDQLSQAIGLLAAIQAREQLSQEDALLTGMLAGKRITTKDRVAFTDMASAREADTAWADYILTPANLAVYNASLAGSGSMQKDLAGIEQAVAAGTPVAKLPVNLAGWQHLADTLLQDEFNGGVALINAILVADHQISHSAWVRVAVTSGIGLLGLLVTILVTTLVGRGIIRRLNGLERSALTLAEDQLPDVITRLRRGEDVDVATEAPPLRVGGDEIGRVGQAFGLVRQTAIRAAVDEAKLRRGLNDVFRSLARRSQSLLHRQLTLLDQMERRATDPEALDDLFRLDHLTTRMRRHAEGLVILAGAPPGRGWSSPVRMVDVMRGAIAEVEDYARVSVATRSQAALAGSAVADVIHLLAELIENATTLSPPYTSVRVSGDTVANGFAIEVEDRGLGMSPPRIAELNERLASPPEFNPSDSEQLGLFVVSQLAKRHGIRVTLKASPYGGTAAVVLIPRHLVVTEEAFRAGLPGGTAAIGIAPVAAVGRAGPAGPQVTNGNGNHAGDELAGPAGLLTLRGVPEAGPPGLPDAPGVRISGPLRRSQGSTSEGLRGAHHAGRRGAANGGTGPGPDELPRRHREEAAAPEPANDAEPPAFDVFTPRHGQGLGVPGDGPVPETTTAGTGASYASSPPYPDGGFAPYPDARSAPYPGQPAPFPGWTGPGVAGTSPGSAAPGPAAPAGPATPMTPMTPMASPRAAKPAAPPWELSRQTGPLPVVPGDADPGSPGAGTDLKGLPRRVKQASLAPQLRANPPQRATSPAASPGPASGPTPAEIRQTMSALQRGWQEGRSQHATGPGDPSREPGGQGPAPVTAWDTEPAADESRGGPDGT
jgi:signal transduction histidine kinase